VTFGHNLYKKGVMSDLRPLATSISQLTSATFSKKFVALGRILNNWNDIIGPELAVKAQPVKIHYRKPKDKDDKPQATLEIAATSSDATVLHYQKDLILARINQIFGDSWITAIRFSHIAANTEAGFATFSRPSPVTQRDLEELNQFLSDIDDEDLRNRLEKLGQSVLKKERTQK
jgi:hypothetical protein